MVTNPRARVINSQVSEATVREGIIRMRKIRRFVEMIPFELAKTMRLTLDRRISQSTSLHHDQQLESAGRRERQLAPTLQRSFRQSTRHRDAN